MASDFLDGKMDDLTGLLPDDDPNVRVFVAQRDVCELQKRQDEIFAALGKEAYARYGPEVFLVHEKKLEAVHRELALAKDRLSEAIKAQEDKGIDESRRVCVCTCACCGHENPEGTKYCQACGAKLIEWEKIICGECGAELVPGARFCGQCGAKQP